MDARTRRAPLIRVLAYRVLYAWRRISACASRAIPSPNRIWYVSADAILPIEFYRAEAYGFGLDGRCVPEEHKEPDIPDDFCERNSGLIFFGDAARSKEMTRNWLEEMRDRPTADGHDQGPLRRVLWRRRDVLYDLAPNVQCRRCTKRYGVDPCEYLAWHSHRPKRLQVFTNRTLACGFRDDRLSRR